MGSCNGDTQASGATHAVARTGTGNAGAAITMIGRALERLASRDPCSSTFEESDFALDQAQPRSSSSLLGSLHNVEHIQRHLKEVSLAMSGSHWRCRISKESW